MTNDHGQSPGKPVTRYGVVHAPVAVIGNEERFAWQKPEFGSDMIYELPETKSNRGISFGSSIRAGLTDDNPDTKKRSTGPGSYDSATGYPHLSDYPSRSANRFASAPRQSMAMKTASPGAVYDITRQYWNGPEKSMGIGFNRDSRLSLSSGLNSANAEMLWPKMSSGPAITMGARLEEKGGSTSSPGPIYDVHEKIDFRTGPSYSFGNGRSSRFGEDDSKPVHPPQMANDHGKSTGKHVTRYGVAHAPVAVIGNEERFAWQKPEFGSDVIYELPETKSNRGISFGSSTRAGLTDDNPDTKKRSTGPGSYDSATGYPHLSDYPSRSANRFASAPRQSMAMKTASPGAVYDITRQYWNGPEKSMGIGFNRDSRLSLSSGLNSANAEMLWPKMSSGPAITMGSRPKVKNLAGSSPGPIYDVHEKVNFKTGPAHSFGKGRSARFGLTHEDESKKPHNSSEMTKSIGKPVTRYGVAHAPVAAIGNEERFAWQKPEFGSDVIYELPETKSNRGISFGSSTRAGLTDDNPDTKKRSTGPGSYDSATGYPHLSDYPSRSANRFASAPRQSMAMKTASPGAVYDITRQYWNGPEKSMGIGFNRDSRLSLGTGLNSENAEILWPKLPPGPSITMGARLKVKNLSGSSPGPIYDVHKKIDFKTGPAHSFGRGRNSRFGQISHLPDNGD